MPKIIIECESRRLLELFQSIVWDFQEFANGYDINKMTADIEEEIDKMEREK